MSVCMYACAVQGTDQILTYNDSGSHTPQQKFLMARCRRMSQLFGYTVTCPCACIHVHTFRSIQCDSARTQPMLGASKPQTPCPERPRPKPPGATAFTGTMTAMLGFGVWRLRSQTSVDGLGIVRFVRGALQELAMK